MYVRVLLYFILLLLTSRKWYSHTTRTSSPIWSCVCVPFLFLYGIECAVCCAQKTCLNHNLLIRSFIWSSKNKCVCAHAWTLALSGFAQCLFQWPRRSIRVDSPFSIEFLRELLFSNFSMNLLKMQIAEEKCYYGVRNGSFDCKYMRVLQHIEFHFNYYYIHSLVNRVRAHDVLRWAMCSAAKWKW